MTPPVSKLGLDLKRLAPGFHRRRFAARDVGFDAWIWRGDSGPTLLLNGGTRGDEYEGPTLLRQWAESWRPARLRGTVVMVPVLNEGAFFAGRSCHPADGANLDQAFPGAARGGPTSRLAHLFDTQLLAQATHYVDLHSGGAAYEVLSSTGYGDRDDAVGRMQRAMAAGFDVFLCWTGALRPGCTLSAAHARKIPAIATTCRSTTGLDARDLADLHRGLDNLLRIVGCLPGRPPPGRRRRIVTAGGPGEPGFPGRHPAPCDGLFVPGVKLGQRVRPGRTLGFVHALSSSTKIPVKATRGGRVVLVRRQRSVRQGEALYALAPP